VKKIRGFPSVPIPRAELLNQIDAERLARHIEQLSEIGRTAQGGVTRLAFTPQDMAGRNLLREWMQEAGLDVQRDAVGNLIGSLRGRDANAPILACGSHIDSVVNAGKYDGIVGMVAAVECARVLHERGGLNSRLRVINFVMEESSRFGAGYGFGSRVMAGFPIGKQELFARDRSKVLQARAIQELKGWETGTRIATERTALRAAQEDIDASRFDWSHVRAFIELHIEQGPVLERAQKQIGIVTAVAAPTRLHLLLTGEQNHSGTTPMNLRHDALAAAAEIILAVEHIAKQDMAHRIVATVGMIESEPNVMNVIPGRVELRVDVRSANAGAKREAVSAMQQTMREICAQRGIGIEINTLTDEPPVEFSQELVDTITRVCTTQNLNAMKMPSGAGHDAAHVASVSPAAMIFIPSRGGISHDPHEFSAIQDIQRGSHVLLGTLLELDNHLD
jgi:N-carbamoyl-L-amino-acid hydrolase